MARQSLLYASPMPPARSGIAFYSSVLLAELERFFHITLLLRQNAPGRVQGTGAFRTLIYGVDQIDFTAFDQVLYNLGHHPLYHSYIYDAFLKHPAPVILHDVVLYTLTTAYYRNSGRYYSKLYQLSGAAGLTRLKRLIKKGLHPLQLSRPETLPLNGEIIRQAPLLLVHSEDARQCVLRVDSAARVQKIPMPVPFPTSCTAPTLRNPGNPPSNYLKERYGIPDDARVIGSFGQLAGTKLNHLVCQAVVSLQAAGRKDLHHVLVGEGPLAGQWPEPPILRTGYLPEAAYQNVLERCDLVTCLRFPSKGETSMGLLRAMAAGKPCLVTDTAWFSELPDAAVFKVPPTLSAARLTERLDHLLSDPVRLKKTGRAARKHVWRQHGVAPAARRLARLLHDSVFQAVTA